MRFFQKIFGKQVADQITPSCDDEYNQLLRECAAEVEGKNTELAAEYGFGQFERWDIDQEIGDLIFSDGGVPTLICKVVVLGSFSESSQTWMWGWANPSLLDHLTDQTKKVRAYGEEKNVPDLVTEKTEATEGEAWALASYACRILDGLGLYRGPTGNGFVIMMITQIQKSEQGDQADHQ
jgi:hypothetical protein